MRNATWGRRSSAPLVLGSSRRASPEGSARDPLQGSASAPVTVYEMSDFQCPYCRKHALEVFPALEQEYVRTGKVRWVYINFPLASIHANALPAAEIAMCAARMGKFWPVHDLLFQHQETWAPLKEPGPFLLSLADSVQLPRPALVKCLQSKPSARRSRRRRRDRSGRARPVPPRSISRADCSSGPGRPRLWRQILDSIYAKK